jgi:uncharacterized membrane protein YccC
MRELLGFAARLRCATTDPHQALRHRLRVGLAVAALILLISILR